jgi:hypothetical protein
MSTGSFKKLPVCCPMCGEHFAHPRGLAHFSTQGHGSGDFEFVCNACGFDGGVQTVAEPDKPGPGIRPEWCPMCGCNVIWIPGDHWGLACTCGWIGRLHDYRNNEGFE